MLRNDLGGPLFTRRGSGRPTASCRPASLIINSSEAMESSTLKRPRAVVIMRILAILQVVIALLMAVVAFTSIDAHPAEGGVVSGFRAGVIKGLGYDPATFSAYEAGRAMAPFLIALLLALLLLRFIARRSLTGIRIVSVFMLIISFGAGSVALVPLVVVVLAFLRSTREYCQSYDDAEPVTERR